MKPRVQLGYFGHKQVEGKEKTQRLQRMPISSFSFAYDGKCDKYPGLHPKKFYYLVIYFQKSP